MRPGRAVVTASHPLAAEAGAQILREGGNAVDAAAAVQLALNVVEPLASGLGGGAFTLIHLTNGETILLDSRETAPAASKADQFLDPAGQQLDNLDQVANGLAVGVPGTLLGLAEGLRRWGSRPLSRLVQPAIALAESGFRVAAFLARRLAQHTEKLRRDPASAALFLPGGRPLAEGDLLVQGDLARTLRLIGERGPDVFYRGDLARAIVAAVAERGGRMTRDDLAVYRVVLRAALRARYRGTELLTVPPPGAGVSLLQMLALLEPFDLARLERCSPARLHLELQAMRLALIDKTAWLGDPDFAEVPVAGLLDSGYLADRRRLLTEGALAESPAPARPPGSASAGPSGASQEHGQTTHFVVADRRGNLVCCTTTIEDFFGSGITVPGYGFLLNNELTDFAVEPAGPNRLRPLARPASSMVPTLVLREGEPWLALGSPGGQTIVTAVLQVLLGLIDDGLSLPAAIDAPRCFAAAWPRLTWERGLPDEVLAALASLGHRPSQRPTTIGSVQAVLRDPVSGEWVGAADPRRDGAVVYVG